VHLEAGVMSTKIPYLDEVWNPTTGCSPISPGCAHCWAERMARRFNTCRTCHGEGGFNYAEPPFEPDGNGTIEWQICTTCGGDPDWHFRPTWHQGRLDQPLHWRKHRRVGVCFMGDLFHPQIANDWLQDEVFAVMEQCPQHDFLVLTKRAYTLHDYIVSRDSEQAREQGIWPLPNVWLGVTICNQEEADEKIPILLDTPAAVRWVSYEPALAAVDFTHYLPHWCPDCLTVHSSMTCWHDEAHPKSVMRSRIDWIVVGGETGPGARPMQPEWALDVWRQCRKAGVAFYFKQLGTSREGNDPNLRISELSEFYDMQATREFPIADR
jgi:protein gp37